MNKLEKYSSYKDSGVEWLGEIPEHWEVEKLFGLCNFIRGNSSFSKDELLNNGKYVALQYGKTYKVDEVNEKYEFYVNDEFYKSSQIVNFGDTIFISTSETIEDLGHSAYYKRSDLGLLGGEQILLNSKIEIIDSKYLYFSSKVFSKELQKFATGIKVFRFNINDLKTIYIPLPPKEEQTKIASFLDKKTTQIDEVISQKEKLIELLKERKQIVINDAVTKGLDKNVEFVDSGVEWIGKIPKHWKLERLGSNFIERREKVSDKDFEPLSVTKNGVVPQLDSAAKSNDGDNRKLVRKGDFVINSRSDRKGSSGLSKLDGSVSLINIVLKPIDINSDFSHILLKSNGFIEEFYRNGHGIVADLWTTRFWDMKSIMLAIPPKDEQIKIVEYIENQTSKIDIAIELQQNYISKLKEYKASLIDSVVTGKVRVG
ncbi:restriction endonuclease subunit S [Aliarcobacter cryaerophilus]|uniref:restriction endonuclease subunit S n=1 Tax=Aliarcobacter cryaerophilus TaxID=28198 RepID=UPI0021B50A4A|nr:restriction endonuclease subunit S [Aliarcobacter cryaerophilus]MCT7528736.1 restriction endonuclease subunit S [Aliarcobacter cryaerophilus]